MASLPYEEGESKVLTITHVWTGHAAASSDASAVKLSQSPIPPRCAYASQLCSRGAPSTLHGRVPDPTDLRRTVDRDARQEALLLHHRPQDASHLSLTTADAVSTPVSCHAPSSTLKPARQDGLLTTTKRDSNTVWQVADAPETSIDEPFVQ